MRFLLLLSLTFSLFMTSVSPPLSVDAANCRFVMGFKKLHDQIPNIVGACLEDAHFELPLGEALQATTGTRTDGGFGGLLVWRKVDNLVFFTDGVTTWLDSPQGVQKRLNTERFPWELDSLKNTAYNIDGMPFVLNMGKADLNTDEPNLIQIFALLDENNVAYGDLNGDGLTDAAARLVINTGGSGQFNYLVATVSGIGSAQQPSVLLGDRVRVNGISISNGIIALDVITHGPNDPLCCPTVPMTVRYRLVNGKLEATG